MKNILKMMTKKEDKQKNKGSPEREERKKGSSFNAEEKW